MAERDIVAAILRLLKKTPFCFAWKEHDELDAGGKAVYAKLLKMFN